MKEPEKVLLNLQKRFPGTKLVNKQDSIFMKIINVLLMIITFGQMKVFMTGYVTTIGRTIYVTKEWDQRGDKAKAITLRHEGIHIAQAAKMGRILFSLKYLLWPVPVVWALGRRDIEQEAYEETMRARAEYYGIKALDHKGFKRHLLLNFKGPAYFWMYPWPKSLEKWYNDSVEKIKNELS